MSTPDFVLTTRQFEVLWSNLDLGKMPYPLDLPTSGVTPQERAELVKLVYRELEEADLAHGGRLDAVIEELLRLLADHDVAVDGVADVDRTLRALAATDEHIAVLAVVDGNQVRLQEIRPTEIASAIVGVLPARQPGPGHALSVSLATLDEAIALSEAGLLDDVNEDDDPWSIRGGNNTSQALVQAGVGADDAATVSQLADDRVAGGQFGISWRGSSQFRTERSTTLVNWFDTDQGRYLMVRENDWLSLAPADANRIATRLELVLDGR